MKLTVKEFIQRFVTPNSLIRLVYKNKSGHEVVGENWDSVSMDHVIIKSNYADRIVVGVTDILVQHGHYTESINLVIER